MYVAEVRFPGMCRRRHFLETFVEEATLMSRLHHPNLQTLVGQCLHVFAPSYKCPSASMLMFLSRDDTGVMLVVEAVCVLV